MHGDCNGTARRLGGGFVTMVTDFVMRDSQTMDLDLDLLIRCSGRVRSSPVPTCQCHNHYLKHNPLLNSSMSDKACHICGEVRQHSLHRSPADPCRAPRRQRPATLAPLRGVRRVVPIIPVDSAGRERQLRTPSPKPALGLTHDRLANP